VSRPNSAENRLVKLLRYLADNYPLDGWDQYLAAHDVPRWSRILVAGHSQGGGHAAILGKYYSTAGVVMFASMDYSFNRDSPAAWVGRRGNTRLEKFFAAAHTEDRTAPVTVMRRYWNAFGFREIWPVVNIDHVGFPYADSNTLITSVQPAKLDKELSNYHNSLCMDADTPLRDDGVPLLRDLWVYLLTAPLAR
jgi:pimeloyl-ACP methyl ester carboxylesterase